MAENSLQDRLTSRIYHEDLLLAQRTYNFLTANAFLAGALAVTKTKNDEYGLIGYAIVAMGWFLSLCQLAWGRRTECYIQFFRQYLKEVEQVSGIKVDSAWNEFANTAYFDFSEKRIAFESSLSKKMSRLFPWPLVKSSTRLVGAIFPTGFVIFWWVVGCVIAFQEGAITVVVWSLIALLSLFVVWMCSPGIPKVFDKASLQQN